MHQQQHTNKKLWERKRMHKQTRTPLHSHAPDAHIHTITHTYMVGCKQATSSSSSLTSSTSSSALSQKSCLISICKQHLCSQEGEEEEEETELQLSSPSLAHLSKHTEPLPRLDSLCFTLHPTPPQLDPPLPSLFRLCLPSRCSADDHSPRGRLLS